MTNVIHLRPRPPTTTIAVNAIELRLMVASLDNSLCDLEQHAPGHPQAGFGVRMLRARLQIVLAQLEREQGAPA